MKKKKNLINDCNLPDPIFEALKIDYYEKAEQESFCSTTELLMPPKRFWGLKKIYKMHYHENYALPASSQVFSQQGHMVHSFFESALGDNKDYIVEKRLYHPFKIGNKEYIISGMFDLYHIVREILFDYKNMSISKYNRGVGLSKFYGNAQGFDKYEEQLNIYAYMMEKSGYPVSEIRLLICLRDWDTMAKKQQPSLPDSPYTEVTIRKWTEEELITFISSKIEEKIAYEGYLVNDIPECPSEERWERLLAYKVFKCDSNGNPIGSALPGSSKLETEEAAQEFIDKRKDVIKARSVIPDITNTQLGYTIVKATSNPLMCMDYCTLSTLNKCNYWRNRKLEEAGL